MRYKSDCEVTRWLAYFDLLGVRELIAASKEGRVFDAYDYALKEFDGHTRSAPTLQHAWFSDTFLIVASDGSRDSFCRIDRTARFFVSSMLRARIPLRGAVSCERLYADFEERVFFGNGL